MNQSKLIIFSLIDMRIGECFRIVKKVGSGAFGDIYKGQNMLSGEEVAIKLEPANSKYP